MDRNEALRLLRAGIRGIEEWNRLRREGEVIPSLTGADLAGTYLAEVHLGRVDLTGTDLTGALLNGAHLDEARLVGARLDGAYLLRARLTKAQLDGASLDGTILTKAQLGGASLIRARLAKAHLDDARLRMADLSGAILTEARLDRAYLKGTILDGAHLGKAILYEAHLDGTRLDGAILDGAYCSETIFADVDLSKVEGLDAVRNRGPSHVSTSTLIRSRGKIPEKFLRGCGLPDVWIAYLPSLLGLMQPIQFHSCFISYSSKDEEFAKQLYTDLQAKGVRCWFAPEDLKIGERLRIGIDESIRVHDKLLLILSKYSTASDWVEKEVEKAMEKERKEKRTVLFPIRLDDAVMEVDSGWPADIHRGRNIGDFRNWKDDDAYRKAFTRLLRDLKAEAAEDDEDAPGG